MQPTNSGREHHCTLATDALNTGEDWINFHRKFREGCLAKSTELV